MYSKIHKKVKKNTKYPKTKKKKNSDNSLNQIDNQLYLENKKYLEFENFSNIFKKYKKKTQNHRHYNIGNGAIIKIGNIFVVRHWLSMANILDETKNFSMISKQIRNIEKTTKSYDYLFLIKSFYELLADKLSNNVSRKTLVTILDSILQNGITCSTLNRTYETSILFSKLLIDILNLEPSLKDDSEKISKISKEKNEKFIHIVSNPNYIEKFLIDASNRPLASKFTNLPENLKRNNILTQSVSVKDIVRFNLDEVDDTITLNEIAPFPNSSYTTENLFQKIKIEIEDIKENKDTPTQVIVCHGFLIREVLERIENKFGKKYTKIVFPGIGKWFSPILFYKKMETFTTEEEKKSLIKNLPVSLRKEYDYMYSNVN
tara:strand:- start:10259 stop:11383 length:1125 start_codon:yes stop_codon:yes gene_type:complete